MPPEDFEKLANFEIGYSTKEVVVLYGKTKKRATVFIAEKDCDLNCGPTTAYLRLLPSGAQDLQLPGKYIERIRQAGRRG